MRETAAAFRGDAFIFYGHRLPLEYGHFRLSVNTVVITGKVKPHPVQSCQAQANEMILFKERRRVSPQITVKRVYNQWRELPS